MLKQQIKVEDVLSGDDRAIARAMSLVENDDSYAAELMDGLYPETGKTHRLGITGPPGAGKSTLADSLTEYYRSMNMTVGIVAVDPTSPFTGGALLGDRLRFQERSKDKGVFIRSMASRGSVGGISRKTHEVADILDAAGKDIVIIETVGVGQSELEIADASDTTVVVLVPESGDDVQAMKAGLMEIADVFVLNKSDHDGANRAYEELSSVLALRDGGGWEPKIIKTCALSGEGVDELAGAATDHRNWLETNGKLESRRLLRLKNKVINIISEHLEEDFWTVERLELLDSRLHEVQAGLMYPYSLADELLRSK